MKCDIRTVTVGGKQQCRKEGIYPVMMYGKAQMLCDRHHAGLACPGWGIRCMHKSHDHSVVAQFKKRGKFWIVLKGYKPMLHSDFRRSQWDERFKKKLFKETEDRRS